MRPNRGVAANNARRIKQATTRSENQPYSFVGDVRTPRLGGASQILWCQLPSSLGPATGTWPSLTPTSVSGVTIYRSVNGALVALSGTWKVYNWYAATFATGKTTAVSACGDGTFQTVNQNC